jgi:predicted small lipoprotein YifL
MTAGAMNKWRMDGRLTAVAIWGLCALCGCGQKGALYLPDHAPQPVLSAPVEAPPAVPAAAPATAPAATPDSAPPAGAAAPPDTTTTRKAPRDPDPTTAR